MVLFKSLGIMSGTSVDGIDAAILETDGLKKIRTIATLSTNYHPSFQILLKSAEFAVNKEQGDMQLASVKYQKYLQEFIELNKLSYNIGNYFNKDLSKISIEDIIYHSTILHSELASKLIKLANNNVIDVIGYHGQALYHNPAKTLTIQVGNGQLLANKLGIQVINNFRKNDVMNGGQGAPLAPIYHHGLALRDNKFPVAVVNCGGIANLTIVNSINEHEIVGFDTGPGNVLIDKFIKMKTNHKEQMDQDGKYGVKGSVNEKILNQLLARSILLNGKNYFNIIPPKSLDPLNIELIPEIYDLEFNDAVATLEAFTALSIVESVKFIKQNIPKLWVLAGGGWRNPIIKNKLIEYLTSKIGDVRIVTADEINWSSQYMEAELFAYLAVRSLQKMPISFPNTTNVKSATLGGDLYLPTGQLVSAST